MSVEINLCGGVKSSLVKILEMHITDLDLCSSTCNILISNKIETVKDIASHTEEELLDILDNEVYFDEIKYKIELLGISFLNDKTINTNLTNEVLKNGTKYIAEREKERTIDELDLTVRAYNILKRAGVHTIEDLLNADISEIISPNSLNRKAFEEISLKREELIDLIDHKNKGDFKMMNVDELAKKLAKELIKDQGLKMKTLVFFDEKKDLLDELYDEILLLRDAWDDKFNKLSERMQESSRGSKIEEIYELLDSISSSFEDVDSLIEELKEKLEDN